ncbi:MAG TPA: phosphotransferase [Phycisphaerae bacterium]|nr:phosphotransferase [Phycisphaerae bacterium]
MSEREKFGADELAIVLSHYDIGVIDAIKEFPRGSRKAPKLLVRSEKGEYLLKRRARGKDDPFKVAFCHALQLYLAEKQFPLPHLIGTRRENNSMLQILGTIYELFEYIRGTGYDNSLEATSDSARILALYHKLLRDYTPEYEPPTGSFHNSRQINNSLDQIPDVVNKSTVPSGESAVIGSTLEVLRNAYVEAADRVNKFGLPDWPLQIVHCDWHPGNMLFRNQKVVAVIDYDSARLQQRIIDMANGVLQFSIIGGGDDPSTWPDHVDESRFKGFIRGYDSVEMISVAELQTIPWLMIEAMVAESAFHIAATGSFGRIEGLGFLKMIERKVRWVHENSDRLIKLASD